MPRKTATLIFATAVSRLHADILIARLKRAGIAVDLVSALYQPHHRPNSAVCWLNGSATRWVSTGEAISISGLLRFALGERHRGKEPLASLLNRLGVAPAHSLALEKTLLENRIVLCIQAEEENEFAIITRTLRENAAENIIVAETETTRAVPGSLRWCPSP